MLNLAMSGILESKSTEFLERLKADLANAEQRYKDVSATMEEYISVRSFIIKEMVRSFV